MNGGAIANLEETIYDINTNNALTYINSANSQRLWRSGNGRMKLESTSRLFQLCSGVGRIQQRHRWVLNDWLRWLHSTSAGFARQIAAVNNMKQVIITAL